MDKRDAYSRPHGAWVEEVRELVRQRVEQSSLRAAEQEIGISRSSVHTFIKGAYPHTKTAHKLWLWYDAYERADGAEAADPAYRGVPLDVLREWAQEEVNRTSIRVAAKTLGIPRGALHLFITDKTEPRAQTIRALGLAYLRAQGRRPDSERDVRAALAALTILAGFNPDPKQSRRELLREWERGFERRGVDAPEWSTRLRAWVDSASGLTVPPPHSDLDVDRVRELMRQYAERTSVRAVARSSEMQPSTVADFLNGATPGPRMRGKLAAWYREEAGAQSAEGESTSYRNVPVDELREFYRRIVEEDGVRVVAQAAGLVRNTLAKFVHGAEPFAQTRRLLGLYYMYEKENGPVKRQQIRQAQQRSNQEPGAPEPPP